MSNQRATPGTEVLIVEDERRLADVFASVLAGKHRVRTAYSGEEALDLLHSGVDVVLLDRRLPGISGAEVLEEIRERNIDCRVAIVSAVEPGDEVRTMDVDEYIRKPVSCSTLEQLVDDLACRDGLQPAEIPQGALERVNIRKQMGSQLPYLPVSISETN